MPTIQQLVRLNRTKIINTTKAPALVACPQRRGICTRVYTTTPKKPNSAERKIVRVKVKGGKMLTASIPGQGHNLQKFSVVLVRGGRANDVPACRYKVVRGKYDFSTDESFERKKSRSK